MGDLHRCSAVFSNAPSDVELENACETVLKIEAEYLDDRRFEDWLEMLDADLVYEVPVRTLRENWQGDGISTRAFYMKEDVASIETRVRRLRSQFAWAESPSTRTRRLVSNIRLVKQDGALLSIRSNVAIFCYKGEAAQPQILTADRRDEWRITDQGPRLVRRISILDSAVLGLEALSIFI